MFIKIGILLPRNVSNHISKYCKWSNKQTEAYLSKPLAITYLEGRPTWEFCLIDHLAIVKSPTSPKCAIKPGLVMVKFWSFNFSPLDNFDLLTVLNLLAANVDQIFEKGKMRCKL